MTQQTELTNQKRSWNCTVNQIKEKENLSGRCDVIVNIYPIMEIEFNFPPSTCLGALFFVRLEDAHPKTTPAGSSGGGQSGKDCTDRAADLWQSCYKPSELLGS